MTEPISTKTCSFCLEAKPIDYFRRRKAGTEQRHHKCRECHNLDCRLRKEAKRSQELTHFLWQLSSGRYKDRHLIRLTIEMLQRFKGVRGLADFWYRQVQGANPGSRLSTYTFTGILQLIRLCDQVAPRRNLDDMDDAELEAELQRELEKVAQNLLDGRE